MVRQATSGVGFAACEHSYPQPSPQFTGASIFLLGGVLAWQVGLCPAHDVAGAHGAGLSCHFSPAHKQRQRRDAADVETCTQAGHSFGVNLGHAHVRFELASRLRVGRCHGPAWAAPRGPKVHQQWNMVAQQVFLKRCSVQCRRLGGEQGFFALPAVGCVAHLIRTHAVGGVAMGADDVE